jgi:hypothetical protein
MSTKDNLENMAKNTWLAGLGSINSSKDALGKSIEAAQEKSNSIYNELMTRGEKIQRKIDDKKDEIQAKGKKLLGIGLNETQTEKLTQLNAAVDELTTVVAKLIEQRNAEAKKVAPKAARKPASKVATKTSAKPSAKSAPKKAAKATTKVATKTAPRTTAKPTTKAVSKKATETTAKAAPKATSTTAKTKSVVDNDSSVSTKSDKS